VAIWPSHMTRAYESEGGPSASLAQGHMEGAHMTRSPEEKGLHPNFGQKWVFKLYYMIFNGFLSQFWEILAIFGGSGALFEARSWGEVGSLLPTSSLYKPEVLGSLRGRFRIGKC
jgi:hypothetical protein